MDYLLHQFIKTYHYGVLWTYYYWTYILWTILLSITLSIRELTRGLAC